MLKEKNGDLEIIEYLKSPISTDELRSVVQKLNLKAESLVRKGEAVYKDKFRGKQLSDEEWILP